MDKKELNKAIYDVLTSQFKKDNPEAFKKVENAGYVIEKLNGHFHISNPKNRVGKWVRPMRIDCEDTGYRMYFNTTNYQNRKFSNKIDFIDCLEKQRNRYEPVYIESQAVINYNYYIKNKKERIKDYEEDIENRKKKILEIIGDIERYSRYIAEYKEELKENRKKFGLDERR